MVILFLLIIQILSPPLVSAETSNRETTSIEIIDLNQFPLFVHSGFSSDYIRATFSPTDTDWAVLSPAMQGYRSMRVIDIDEFNKHRFFDLHRLKPEEFTYIIPFIVPNSQYMALNKGQNTILGLHLASIGDNWEVYLNGKPIRSERHQNSEGTIIHHRNYRDIIIPFSFTELRSGANTLVFRIIGDPASPLVGLNSSAPYRIAPYSFLKKTVNDRFDASLSLIYIFMGLYIFIINLRKESDKYNRSFGLFSLVLGIYFLARSPSIYQLIADSDQLFKIEITSLFLILPFATKFLSDLTPAPEKQRIITYFIYGFYGLLIIAELLFPPAIMHDLINIWAILSIPTLLYDYFYLVLWAFFLKMQNYLRKISTRPTYKEVLSALRETLLNTPIGNVFIGITLLVLSGIIDTYSSLVVKKNLVTSRYSLLIFTLGSVFVIARRYGSLFNQIVAANVKLASQIDTLNQIKQKIDLNQQLYQEMFTSTIDPILIVDSQFTIQEHNKAAEDLCGTEIAEGKSLVSVLQSIAEPNKNIVNELADIKNKILVLDTPFDLTLNENYRFRFEKCTISNQTFISIRCTETNPIYKKGCFIWGRGTYSLENSMALAESMSYKIASSMRPYADIETCQLLQAAIREMIRNAIEHGNLEIPSRERALAIAEHRYNELIHQRADRPVFQGRKVLIKYIITPRKLLIKITDAGKGFNHQAILHKVRNRDAEFLEKHQGIYVALAAFDRVVYNETGNQVTLKKTIPVKDDDYESKAHN